MSEAPIIQLQQVFKIYQTGDVQVHALRGVDLEIYPGDFLAIRGTSGSGKSTMMNLLGCLDRPTHGLYLFEGQDVSKFGRNQLAQLRNRRLGFVFQSFNLIPRTSALDNVQMPLLYNRQFSARKRLERAKNLLERFGLGSRLDHLPNQLSGGQQQRVAIARALVNDPKILLADEPTGNLDTRTGLEILKEFQRLNRDQGQTIIMVTHDEEIANCCLRQIFMQDGQIRSDGPTQHPRDAAIELARLDENNTTDDGLNNTVHPERQAGDFAEAFADAVAEEPPTAKSELLSNNGLADRYAPTRR